VPNSTFGQKQSTIDAKKLAATNSLRIISHVILQLENKAHWNKNSTFQEKCDQSSEVQTLRCAIKKAQIEITGKFENRTPFMKIIRKKIRKYFFFRQGVHPINSFNTNKKTTHKELLFLLDSVKTELE